jgi:glycosyltransferase involved in cell wall biosynthesis
MKNVLVLIYTPTYGGPHNQVLQLYEPLKKLGWNTIAVIPEGDDVSYQRLTGIGVTVERKPLHRLRATKNLSVNGKYIRTFNEDVKIIETLIEEYNISLIQICGLMHIHGAIAARRKKIPVVWQLLSTFAPKWMRGIYTPIVSKFSDVVMTTGDIVAKEHPFHTLFKKKHMSFYPPVDTEKFTFDAPKRSEARKYLNVPENSILIGTVGNQNRQKSHDVFIKIAARLSQKDNFYFRIVGRHTPANAAYYQQNVTGPANEMKLFDNDRLQIVDATLPIATILNAFDVFLLTSHAEGVPTVILEAMATGVPVISSEVGAISEIIKPGKNGFTYPFGHTEQAAHYIETLMGDAPLRERIQTTNRQEAVEKYDVHACAERHDAAYRLAIVHDSKKEKEK